MKKYIIEYDKYDDVLLLLGHEVPHSNLEHVKTVIVDLTEQEYEALVGAGINIVENQMGKELLYAPSVIDPYSFTLPSPIQTYLNLTASHNIGFDGTGVKVGIIDSGCRDLHAATVNIITREDFTGFGANVDLYNHGSKGCMIVGQANNFNAPGVAKGGIAPGCEIYSLKAFDGGQVSVIAAINYAIANGLDIINISLDMGFGLTTAINAALTAGIIVVCASGNNTGALMAHPANVPGVIAVNQVEYSDATIQGSHLTYNDEVGITHAAYNNGSYQVILGGTSYSAFITTGMLAIYKQKFPSLNTEKAINLLRKKALEMDGYTYTIDSTTKNKKLNYETGGGFLAPIN